MILARLRDERTADPSETWFSSLTEGHPDGKGSDAPAQRPAGALPPGLADYLDYEIKRELGRGGHGMVYLAHNRVLNRDEALKVVGREITRQPVIFLREMRAVASLSSSKVGGSFEVRI